MIKYYTISPMNIIPVICKKLSKQNSGLTMIPVKFEIKNKELVSLKIIVGGNKQNLCKTYLVNFDITENFIDKDDRNCDVIDVDIKKLNIDSNTKLIDYIIDTIKNKENNRYSDFKKIQNIYNVLRDICGDDLKKLEILNNTIHAKIHISFYISLDLYITLSDATGDILVSNEYNSLHIASFNDINKFSEFVNKVIKAKTNFIKLFNY